MRDSYCPGGTSYANQTLHRTKPRCGDSSLLLDGARPYFPSAQHAAQIRLASLAHALRTRELSHEVTLLHPYIFHGGCGMKQRIDLDDTRQLPYSARELTPKEVREEDIYTFNSPKHDLRRVRVAKIPNLILALKLEFDPDVESYVERPRLLKCDTETYEFSFWYRERSGREYLPLLVPAGSSGPASSGQRRHRKEAQLIAAAEKSQLPLKFEFETDLLSHATEFASRFRMLPSVQLACRFSHRFDLRDRILEVAGRLDRIRISQIVDALEGFPSADVYCVISDLIHAGLLAIDPTVKFTRNAICQVRRP